MRLWGKKETKLVPEHLSLTAPDLDATLDFTIVVEKDVFLKKGTTMRIIFPLKGTGDSQRVEVESVEEVT